LIIINHIFDRKTFHKGRRRNMDIRLQWRRLYRKVKQIFMNHKCKWGELQTGSPPFYKEDRDGKCF
jgi:hypothetical protein